LRTQQQVIAPAVPFLAVTCGFILLRSAWAAILMYHLGILLTLIRARRGGGSREVLGRLPAGPAVLVTAVCACVGPAFLILWGTVAREPADLRGALAAYGLAGTSWWLFAIYYATVHPILEEAFWRGRLASPSARPVASDLLFAAYHAVVLQALIKPPWVVLACAVLCLSAWGWRLLAQRHRGLAIPILSHAAADLSLVLAVELIARGAS
jgi:membrane protease YdiL (CAAX protease family)